MTKIFLHIPKCGGTTLTRWLESRFPEERRFHVNPDDIAGSKAELSCMPAEERERIDLLLGHISYGWHALLPGPCRYFTILRDPISRVVSHYSYVRWMTLHDHYPRSTVEAEGMTLGEYVASGVCDEINNGQVRLLSGIEDIVQAPYGSSKVPYGSNDRALLDRALANIQSHFDVVGVLDDFDSSVKALCRSWRIPVSTRPRGKKNVGERHYEKVVPSPDERRIIEDHNRLDVELYDFVAKRLAPRPRRIRDLAERIVSGWRAR